jgi:hypothetical protein
MIHRTASLALPALACLAALATSTPALADEAQAPKIRPLAGILFTASEGDKLPVPNADGNEAQVDLGGVLDLYAGAEFPLAPNGLALQLTAGVHQSSSSNGVSARRYPLEAILLYPVSGGVRLGAGIRYPARLTFSGAANSNPDAITASPGFLGAVEIRLSEHLALNLRYVEEQYEFTYPATGAYNASHFDAGISAFW